LVDWNGYDRSPKYSPDGKFIAFTSDGGNPTWGREHFAYVIPANGGNGRQLPATPSRNISSITGWVPNGTAVITSESNRTSRRYFNIPLSENGVVSTLTPGKGNYGSLSYNKEGMMALVHEKTEEPGNVFISQMGRFNPARITDINPEFSTMEHGKTEVIRWQSKDGMEIEGLLTYPINYREGKKVPLVLNIHGGPAGVYTEGYTGRSSVYPIQAYAQEGYAVLRANPRGSSGYSKAFRFANRSDWGGMDYEDLMTGVDHLIKLGVADPNDLYVMGWSYGGFMTSTVVTKTDRFKAASVGAGVPNLIGMLTTDIHDFIPWHFEGEMHDNIEKYIKHSSLFHVNNVTTPTQVVHGENDTRVPIAQGYEFYRAIQRKGVDTEMIVYPRMPHGLREPKFIQHCGEAIMKWFKDHSK
jgi:dipeptidyl aminopeptidase/acylaminoacyl peptidase